LVLKPGWYASNHVVGNVGIKILKDITKS